MNVKEQIADAFLEMLKKKSFDRITVTDIVKKCSITRQSFYYHFSDIFSLIEWIMQRECQKIISNTSETDNPRQRVKSFLQFAYDNNELLKCVFNTKELQIIAKILINTAKTFIMEVTDPQKISNMSSAELDMTLDFYTFAIIGFIIGICERGNMDIERTTNQFIKLVEGNGIINIDM